MSNTGSIKGSNVAPMYANIFMAVLEDRAVYPLGLFSHVRCWLRYIDEIFLIWDGTKEELDLFHVQLNSRDRDVQFTLT